MAEQIIEAENGESPCSLCWNREGDKNICSALCKRRMAYADNKPYLHLTVYEEQLKTANALPEPLKAIKPVTQETNWKKAMPVKQKKPELTYDEKMKIIEETDKCLVCGRSKPKYKLRQGLCVSCCYGAWRQNRLEHPVLGSWKIMSQKEVQEARWGRYVNCLIPGCMVIGDRRGVCRDHYRAWRKGSAECVAILGVFKRKGSKTGVTVEDPAIRKYIRSLQPKKETIKPEKPEDETITKNKMDTFCEEGIKEIGREATQPKLIVNSILLDFLLYPDIYAEIKRQSEGTKLPISHVIMNFLSYAIGAVNEEAEKRRRNNVKNNSDRSAKTTTKA